MPDAPTRVAGFTLSGKPAGEVALPGIGSAGGFSGKREHTETFYSYTSFISPTEIWRLDLKTGKSTLCRKPKVAFNPSDYVTKQVFFKSKDGTRIPMFVSHRKGLARGGNNPTYLHGYGGFNISITPFFHVARRVWVQMGGVCSAPRGGAGSGAAGCAGADWARGCRDCSTCPRRIPTSGLRCWPRDSGCSAR